jgi:hypothetical protein
MKRTFEQTTTTQPLFLTNKLVINELSADVNIHDYQLRDHFLNLNNLYAVECKCLRQKHYGKPCRIIHEPTCSRCKRPAQLLVSFQALLFHGDMIDNKLTYGQPHYHEPPCHRCINCRTLQVCVVPQRFECNISTHVVCPQTGRFNRSLTTQNIITHEHVYDIKHPIFYLCQRHVHYHVSDLKTPCLVQTRPCCERATHIQDYRQCFVITTHQPHETTLTKRKTEYIIFDPHIWREQSFNKFMSFVRAVISVPEVAVDRYKSFESSNFAIANIKRYKSGKASIMRTAVTGFETQGLYQTATISCLIPYYAVVVPQQLYRILCEQHYDLDYVLVKRDPSLLPTCMYVCALFCNPDENVNTLTISDQQSKGLNQDQDGDKNAVYFIQKHDGRYDATALYTYKISKMELAAAFRNKCSLLGRPRYLLSETTMLLLERYRTALLNEPTNVYFHKTANKGLQFINDASAGYLRDEYDEFQRLLMHYNRTVVPLSFITTDDLTLKHDRLYSIVKSGAKGARELLDLFLSNIQHMKSLLDRKKDMIDLCNKYIVSNQDLSRNGRKQFTSLYAAQDLIAFNEAIYINKIFYADYSEFPTAVTFMFAEVSLELFLDDLLAAD